MTLKRTEVELLIRRWQAPNRGMKLTWMVLGDYFGLHGEEWTCWPGEALLAEETQSNTGTIRRHLAEMERIGVITRRPQGREGGGRFYNLIVLNVAMLIEETAQDARIALRANRANGGGNAREPGGANRANGESSPLIGSTTEVSFGESAFAASRPKEIPALYDGKGEPPSVEAVRLRREPFPPQFLAAWEMYPKECDHDRLGAYKAWRARVVEAPKAGVGRVTRMANLLLAVRGYAYECDDLDRADEFIKNAATFFGAANESVMKHCIRVARDRLGSATVAS